MKILIASDHGGLELKEFLLQQNYNEAEKILNTSIEMLDLGPHNQESVDYPDFAHKLCKDLKAFESKSGSSPAQQDNETKALGVLICGTGQGMAMTANKYPFIRAALCWSKEVAHFAKSHNNANILCLGGRVTKPHEALEIFNEFLITSYEGGRHDKRLKKIKDGL